MQYVFNRKYKYFQLAIPCIIRFKNLVFWYICGTIALLLKMLCSIKLNRRKHGDKTNTYNWG